MSEKPLQKVGVVRELWRYPVKSMRGEAVDETEVYWYGLDGDRRYAFVQRGHPGSFPWLTGRELPELVRYHPYFVDPARPHEAPVRVITPDGRDLAITDPVLAAELAGRFHDKGVDLLQLNRGASDTGAISLISLATGRKLSETHGRPVDLRRLRQNILLDPVDDQPYIEDRWAGQTLVFGRGPERTELLAIRPIQRCQMVNVDPDSGERTPAVLKTINRSRDNCAGIYLWPRKVGRIRTGDEVFLADS